MNELQFKRHLKDLVHGHHHAEEHDWNGKQPRRTSALAVMPTRPKRNDGKKPTKRK
jgi:hypothetical protein